MSSPDRAAMHSAWHTAARPPRIDRRPRLWPLSRDHGASPTRLDDSGIFVNADFVPSPRNPDSTDPGRLSVANHLKLLESLGYTWSDCIARHANMACWLARLKQRGLQHLLLLLLQ